MEVLRNMHLPPGFGFHPSDAELISHYLKRKIHGQRIDYDLIPEVDIYKHEPWDLPSKCNLPIEDNKWHFFASRDRKYPTGARSNRATRAGYWKSTGKDRAIKLNKRTLGTKKTLVFHEGRPPSGKRTEWIMHEYYIDENECQASPDMKDAFVLCRVTRRDDWALENDNGVGIRNPHPRHLNDDATSVIIVEKQEEATSSGICAGVVIEKQEDATASGICAGEPNHVGTPASAELSNDVAPTEFMAHSPNNESELNAFLEGLLVDLSSDPAVDTDAADSSLVDQDVESSNPGSAGPKMEPDHASPIENGIDVTDYLLDEDINAMLSGLNDPFATKQAYSLMGTDHFISPINSEGTWNGEAQLHQGTRNGEVQLHQNNCYANLSDEDSGTGITIRRRNITASSANGSPSTQRMKLQVGVNRMVTSNSETINQTFKFAGNSGRMRSFKQSDATKSSENLSSQGKLRGTKSTFRSSASFSVLLACVCMIGVIIAAVLHGYYRSGLTL